MHEEYYSVGRLLTRAAGWGLFALLCFWVGGFFGVVMGLVSGLFAFAYIATALGDRVAVRFGQDVVEIRGLGGKVSMRWDDVEDVTLVALRSRLFGFLPTFRSPQLTLIAADTRKALTTGVPVALLDLDREGLVRLVKVMIFARSGGYDLINPKTGVLWSETGAASLSAAPPASAGFGRKGL
jgi:hypothetical protein